MILGYILNMLPSIAYLMVKQTPNNDKVRSSVIGINQQSSEKKPQQSSEKKGKWK